MLCLKNPWLVVGACALGRTWSKIAEFRGMITYYTTYYTKGASPLHLMINGQWAGFWMIGMGALEENGLGTTLRRVWVAIELMSEEHKEACIFESSDPTIERIGTGQKCRTWVYRTLSDVLNCQWVYQEIVCSFTHNERDREGLCMVLCQGLQCSGQCSGARFEGLILFE